MSKTLAGFRRPIGGRVSVLDADPAEVGGASRNRVGAVLQASAPEPAVAVRGACGIGIYTGDLCATP